MPSVFSHGIIGYILFGIKGLFFSIIPDIVGVTNYFYKTIFVYKTVNFNNPMIKWSPINLMSDLDWFLYNISHSLLIWLSLFFIFRKKYLLAPIIGIIMDIALHSKDRWAGPAFLYPFSDYRFDGIHWNSKSGYVITFLTILIILIIKHKDKICKVLFN